MDRPAADGENFSDRMKVTVKFSGRSVSLEIAVDTTVYDLKTLLQPLTNVLPRGQKLIFKGKVLTDELTMASSGINNGSKVMLMATQGLHQGEGPIRKDPPVMPSARRMPDIVGVKKEQIKDSVQNSQFERWKVTGVIALGNIGLTSIPEEVWTCGTSARVLDVSHNSLHEVPRIISCLSSIQKLLLNGNHLPDHSIGWEGITSLKSLTFLSLDHNHLSVLPSTLGALTCLKQLHIANNKLMCIPSEIGFLAELQVLKAENNRLNNIPTSIGGCVSLIEVNFSSNLLVELPETFGNLRNLKALYLSNNGMKSLPKTLFKMCLQLAKLDLHGTEITMDVLRQFEGWQSFDERRRLKHQKQLDFRVSGSGEFDEGADKNW